MCRIGKWVYVAVILSILLISSQIYAGTGAMTIVGEGSQLVFPESSSFVVGNGKVNMGTVKLSSGVGTVTSTAVTAVSRIFLASNQMGGGTSTMGYLFIATRTAGTQFVIQSSTTQDTSIATWLLFEPAS